MLKKRLKSYYKKQKLSKANVSSARQQSYDFLLVIDFEATCEENNTDSFHHEIIEFPAVLIDTRKQEVVRFGTEYVGCWRICVLCKKIEISIIRKLSDINTMLSICYWVTGTSPL